ncbi:unnamed protein product [Mycena citricolor]|uniref:DNA polymerase delta small subunit n=2 Tax=Mycena citricolor TaxID=2018698 RepID=A0AAD2HQ12_9AGAR|nr:unnamed protein product [Mycena citricolor]
MDMPLKPNVMEDIARDSSIPPPLPLSKFFSEDDCVMLEDESGRIQLVGDRVTKARLVTGVIIAVLGIETPTGEFEVVDICTAGLASQSEQPVSEEGMDVDEAEGWIAVTSGLDIGSDGSADAQIQMLAEYLTGESGGAKEQASSARISRLIIAGNSLAPAVLTTLKSEDDDLEARKGKRYGYDGGTFSAQPTMTLSAHLLDIARTMPVHILPGESDPSGTILPQQPFPRAMFGKAASYTTFFCETNPTYLRLGSQSGGEPTHRTLLINSGQPVNDMLKYVPSSRSTPLSLVASTLKWRHMAPTAPDTLWCHPYFSADPFVFSETPDLYLVGAQDHFATKVVSEGARRCRVVLIPRFSQTGILVLVNLRSLQVKCINFSVMGMAGPASVAESLAVEAEGKQ